MFTVLDEAIPLSVARRHDPALALAEHVGLRSRGWETMAYRIGDRAALDRMVAALAERLAHHRDLRFFKVSVVWSSSEGPEQRAAFRARTGLDAAAIVRRPVVADGAGPQDRASLFGFAFAFGWDAAVVSRGARALPWFSHDEHLRSTPPALVRGL